jgi:hypothetical protein
MSIGQTPQSFRGYVGIGKEATYADGVSPSVFVDAVSDGFSLDNNPDFQNTTRARGTYKGEAGPITDEGSLDLPANPENGLGLLLLGALGAESFTANDPDGDGVDDVGEHVYTPADTLDALSMEVDRDTDVVRHLGCGVDTLELSHTAEEKLTASVDVVAAGPDPDVTSSTPAYSDLRNFRFNDATFDIVGASKEPDVQEFSASIENNLDPLIRDARTAGKVDIGERVVSMTATLDFEDRTLFDQFLGAANATDVQERLATVAVNATWTSPETIGGTSTAYELDWNAPKCTVDTHEAQINQNDLVAEDVEFRALVDVGGLGSEVEVTLTNGVLSAY